MKKTLILGAVIGLLAFAGAAFAAYPTLSGYTGLALTPTAAVTATGTLDAAVDYVDEADAFLFRGVFGLAPDIEVGAGFTTFDGDDEWNVNAKWVLPIGPFFGFTHAIGARYNSEDILEAYFTNTRPFPVGDGLTINGTVGLDWIGDIDGGESDTELFFGADTTFANRLTLLAEFDTGREDFTFTARYPFTDMMRGQLGYMADGDGTFFAGVSFSFGAPAVED